MRNEKLTEIDANKSKSAEILDRLGALALKVAELERKVDGMKAEVVRKDSDTLSISRQDVIDRAKADAEVLENTYRTSWNYPHISFWPRACAKEGLYPVHYVEYVIDRKKRTVVALIRRLDDGSVVYKGIAKCAPGDVFNVHIGKAIALRRALQLEIPDEYVNAPAPEKAQVGDVVRGVLSGKLAIVDRLGRGWIYGRYEDGGILRAMYMRVDIIDDSRTGTEREDYGL